MKCAAARKCGEALDSEKSARALSSEFGLGATTIKDHRNGACCCNRVEDPVQAIVELLEKSGIAVEDIGRIDKVKLYEGFLKDNDGEAQKVQMTAVQLTPTWADGPQWPVVQPCKPTVVKHAKTPPGPKPDGFRRAMTLPDIQVGYFVDRAGVMHPTHDERALSVALQLIRYVQPDRIILHGDNLDLPEISRFRVSPAFARTTQATVDRCGLLAAEIRAAAGPDCEIDWLEGNHEARLPNFIMDNAKAAFGLRRAQEPESWPVISVPNLCRLDDHGITYLPGYPANEAWINDRLRVIHGHHVASGGSTAHKYLASERVSTVYGHVHRREWAERTRRNRTGDQTILAMSPGCLCRTDGAVPSTKGGTDLDGLPLSSTEDWQQGVAVFTFEEGNGRFVPEQVPILDGWAIYHGKEFAA